MTGLTAQMNRYAATMPDSQAADLLKEGAERIAELQQELVTVNTHADEMEEAWIKHADEMEEAWIKQAEENVSLKEQLNMEKVKNEMLLADKGEDVHVAVEAMVHKDKRITELEEQLEELQDRLKNGIEYDEENNQYVLVWTERELEQAGREADELMKFFNPIDCGKKTPA